MKLDIKHLKKVQSDKNSTTLQHDKGHKVIIAHSGLSKNMMDKLHSIKMASGGYIEDRDKLNDADTNYKPQPKQDQKPQQQSTMGTVVGPRKTYDQALHDLSSSKNGYADGGEVDEDNSAKKPWEIDTRSPGEVQIQNQLDAAKAGKLFSPEQEYQPSADDMQQAPAPSPQGQSNFQPGIPNQDLMKPMNDASAGIQGGIQQEANAVGAQGAQEAATLKQNMQQQMQSRDEYEQQYGNLDRERQNIEKDYMSGHIDPNHFWSSMGTGSKIATMVGLIFGGFSGGLHGGNAATEYIDKAIDRDINAQTAEMNKKQNMMTALHQRFGDLQSAQQMGRIIQNDMVANQLQIAAAKSKNPIAQARAVQQINEIKYKNAQMQQPLAQRMMVMSMLQKNAIQPEQAIQAMVPPGEQMKVAETMGKVRSLDAMHKDVQQSFDHVAGLAVNGLLSKNDANSAKQAFIGKLIKETEGRYNYEAAQNLAEAVFPKPGDLGKTIPNKRERMNQLFDSMRKEHESVLDSYGLPIPKPAVQGIKTKVK